MDEHQLINRGGGGSGGGLAHQEVLLAAGLCRVLRQEHPLDEGQVGLLQ